MKKTIFNITNEFVELMNEIEAVEGVLTPELEKRLMINEKDRDIKSVAYLEVLRKNEALNIVIDEEIKRLQAFKKRNKTINDRLKNTLVGAVNLFGDFVVGTVEFGTRKSTSVVIDDESKLSKKFKIRKVVETPDKKAIKDALSGGKNVPGAHLSENKSLKIK